MPIDLGKIDEQIRRLQEVRRIAQDPELMAMVEALLVAPGSAAALAVAGTPPEHNPDDDNAKDQKDRNHGSQAAAIREVIGGCADTFTVNDIGDSLRAGGMEITNIAIGKVLRRLEQSKEVTTVKRGIGSMPNTYAKTERLKI